MPSRRQKRQGLIRDLDDVQGSPSSVSIFPLSSKRPLNKTIGTISEQSIPAIQTLWLCIYLPRMAIDAVARDDARPLAVIEKRCGRVLVHMCNDKAQGYGIEPGMPLASALTLCQTLEVFPRDPTAEQRRLNQLGVLAFDFSNTVSLYTTNSVVLEIKASLRLFGGVDRLFKGINKRLKKFGGEAVVTIAPTPRAAVWLTQSTDNRFIFKAEELVSALRDLPVSVLTADKRRLMGLNRSGIATLSDLLRLPRDGVSRRFGSRLIDDLDLALARQKEPLNLFYPVECFSASVELYRPTHKLEYLVSAASTLLSRLEGFLDKRKAATQHIQCVLAHSHEPDTVIDVGSNVTMRKACQFMFLLEEHLQTKQWPAEVTELTVRSTQIDVFFPEQLDLFDTAVTDETRWQQLLERFRVRLGEKALQRLQLNLDHRPEKAQSVFALYSVMEGIDKAGERSRPVWLLSDPQPLKASSQHLCWQGALSLDSEVECIEQGWWDGNDIRRHYRIAHNSNGSRLWLFQDHRSERWFLHGLFG